MQLILTPLNRETNLMQLYIIFPSKLVDIFNPATFNPSNKFKLIYYFNFALIEVEIEEEGNIRGVGICIWRLSKIPRSWSDASRAIMRLESPLTIS